jgi:hypothetical protein
MPQFDAKQESGEEWGNKRWEGGEMWRSVENVLCLYSVYSNVVVFIFRLCILGIRCLLRLDPWGVRSGSDAHARIAIGIRVDASAYSNNKRKEHVGLGIDEMLYLPEEMYMKLV